MIITDNDLALLTGETAAQPCLWALQLITAGIELAALVEDFAC